MEAANTIDEAPAAPVPPPWLPYLVYATGTGEILRMGSCPLDLFATEVGPGEGILLGLVQSTGTHFVRGETLVPYTPEQAALKASPPAFPAAWSNTQFAWVDLRDLAQQKADVMEALKQCRDAAIHGGFSWSGSQFDSDEVSQTRLLGLFVASQSPGFAPTDWRLADNTWRSLSAADAASVYVALAAHLRAQFEIFAGLEAPVSAAPDYAALETIAWPVTS